MENLRKHLRGLIEQKGAGRLNLKGRGLPVFLGAIMTMCADSLIPCAEHGPGRRSHFGRFICLGLGLAVFFMTTGGTPAWAASWKWSQAFYGGGGRFTAIAADPAQASNILLGSDVSGVFASVDAGEHFVPSGTGLGSLAISSIVYHPTKPGLVAVQAADGLYFSRDGGKTYRLASNKLAYPSRFFGGSLLLFKGDTLIVAADNKGVFEIGYEANPVTEKLLPGLENTKVNSIVEFDGVLYAATERGAYRFVEGRFQPINEGFTTRRVRLQDMAGQPGSGLFAVERDEGLFRFDPSTSRWQRTSTPPAKPGGGRLSFKMVTLDPAKPGRLFLGTNPETWPKLVFASEDSGASFQRLERFTLAPDAPVNWAKDLESPEALVFVPGKPGTAYLADWWNLWVSQDAGTSWRQLHKGLQNTVLYDIKRLPGSPETILAATADNGLMVSTDAAKTWTPSMKGVPDGHVRAVRVCPSNPSKRYLLSEPWERPKTDPSQVTMIVCKSTDGGASWVKLPFTVATKRLAGPQADGRPVLLELDPRDEDTVYVGNNGHGIFRVNTAKLAAGQAEGAVEDISRTLAFTCFQGADSLLVDPKNPERLIASTLGGGIWISDNAGKNWTPKTSRWTFTTGLAVDPTRPQRLFAGASEKRVLTSVDGGNTWKEVLLPGERPAHIGVGVVAVDPKQPDIVYAGTTAYDFKSADGLYVSTNGGVSFVPVPLEGPAKVNMTSLSPGAGGLLAGFNGLGIYRLEQQP